jgi:hypothetical protein
MSTAALSERDEGKLWQYLEAAAFIGAGTGVATLICQHKKVEAIAFCTIGFLVGKVAYAGTKLALNLVSPLASKRIQRIAAWSVGTAAAAAGYRILPLAQRPYLPGALFITVVGGAIGAGIRQVLFKSILQILKKH